MYNFQRFHAGFSKEGYTPSCIFFSTFNKHLIRQVLRTAVCTWELIPFLGIRNPPSTKQLNYVY